MFVIPLGVPGQGLPKSSKARVPGIVDSNLTGLWVADTIVIKKDDLAVRLLHPVKAAPAGFGMNIEIELFRHTYEIFFRYFRFIFLLSYKKIAMALIPNNKKKKDGKQPAAAKSNIPGFPSSNSGKGKTSKGAMKNTRLTGGSQRGS